MTKLSARRTRTACSTRSSPASPAGPQRSPTSLSRRAPSSTASFWPATWRRRSTTSSSARARRAPSPRTCWPRAAPAWRSSRRGRGSAPGSSASACTTRSAACSATRGCRSWRAARTSRSCRGAAWAGARSSTRPSPTARPKTCSTSGSASGWARSITARALEPHFDALERELSAQAVSDEALGENDRRFLDEASAHGLPARRTHRYEHGCQGSGRCFTGCPNAAKQGMNVTYVPWALALGARIYCACRVERVVVEHGRAVGVVARTHERATRRRAARRVVRLHARRARHRRGERRSDAEPAAEERPAVGRARRALPVSPRLRRRRGVRRRRRRALRRDAGGRDHEPSQDRPRQVRDDRAAAGAGGGAHPGHRPRVDASASALYPHFAQWAMVVRAEAEGTVRPAWGGGDKVRWTPRASTWSGRSRASRSSRA